MIRRVVGADTPASQGGVLRCLPGVPWVVFHLTAILRVLLTDIRPCHLVCRPGVARPCALLTWVALIGHPCGVRLDSQLHKPLQAQRRLLPHPITDQLGLICNIKSNRKPNIIHRHQHLSKHQRRHNPYHFQGSLPQTVKRLKILRRVSVQFIRYRHYYLLSLVVFPENLRIAAKIVRE